VQLDDRHHERRVLRHRLLVIAVLRGQLAIPPFIGLVAAIAGVGVFRGRQWARPLAVGVGVATILGGVFLLLIVLSELGLPGSFAMLFLPPGLLAILIGGFVVYAALANGAYLHRQGPT